MRSLKRAPGHTSLIDVIERVLDKGISLDAWVRMSVLGIDLLTVETRVLVTSLDRWASRAGHDEPAM